MPFKPSVPRTSHRGLFISGIVLTVIAVAIVIFGISSRAVSDEKLKQWTIKQAVVNVAVITPGGQSSAANLILPGRFEAFIHAPIYARVSGYLKSWKVDIGGQVKAGQLLAVIETPDLDQQILQARADVASAQANAELATTTANRWLAMLKTDSVSRQEVDDKTGDLAAKLAIVKSAQANLDRLLATKNFANIVAPFDGTVTMRATDNGALINVGSGSGSGPALFEVSDVRKLRLYVNVPQNYIGTVKPGTQADITVPEQPGKSFAATVQSSSHSIDEASGTTLVQLMVNNPTGELLPGGFANVSLHQPTNTALLSIPSSALIFDQAGLRIAVVGSDNKVMLKTVTIARDLGKVIELSSGVDASDHVLENPPDGIKDGNVVHVVASAHKQADASNPNKKTVP
jgi:RND family efflux transporter MFP subunit